MLLLLREQEERDALTEHSCRFACSTAMSRKTTAKKIVKTYHATMLVTRVEEWCVEASSAEEARALLQAGEGHRCHLGQTVQVELDQIADTA